MLDCNCEEEKGIDHLGIKTVGNIGKAQEEEDLGRFKSCALSVFLLETSIEQLEIGA